MQFLWSLPIYIKFSNGKATWENNALKQTPELDYSGWNIDPG